MWRGESQEQSQCHLQLLRTKLFKGYDKLCNCKWNTFSTAGFRLCSALENWLLTTLKFTMIKKTLKQLSNKILLAVLCYWALAGREHLLYNKPQPSLSGCNNYSGVQPTNQPCCWRLFMILKERVLNWTFNSCRNQVSNCSFPIRVRMLQSKKM